MTADPSPVHPQAAMPGMLRVLKEEHRNARRLLGMLDHNVGLLANGVDPDYELLLAVSGWFCEYPDRCHHPKEDALFHHLREKDPLASAVCDLAREHRDARARVGRFRDTIQALFREAVVPREKIVGAARSFIDAEREHMKMEEDVLFPLAMRTFDEGDWHKVEAAIDAARDPLFGVTVEEDFRLVHEALLAFEGTLLRQTLVVTL